MDPKVEIEEGYFLFSQEMRSIQLLHILIFKGRILLANCSEGLDRRASAFFLRRFQP